MTGAFAGLVRHGPSAPRLETLLAGFEAGLMVRRSRTTRSTRSRDDAVAVSGPTPAPGASGQGNILLYTISCIVSIVQFLSIAHYFGAFAREERIQWNAMIIQPRPTPVAASRPVSVIRSSIAQTCLDTARGNTMKSGVLAPLQSYLDGIVSIGGAYFKRRSVLLAIHDMKEKKKAPQTLQREALAQCMSLNMRPVPQLIHYCDIATALLRMEVVLRLSPVQLIPQEQQPARLLSPAKNLLWTHYVEPLHASLAAAVSASKALYASSRAEVARRALRARTFAGHALSSIALAARGATATERTVELPSAS